jgi:hypothetical protein
MTSTIKVLHGTQQPGNIEPAVKQPLRLLVCGGRNYADHDAVDLLLSTIHAGYGPITCIIHGAATGADTLAKEWALKNNIKEDAYPADWSNLTQPDAIVRVRRGGMKYDARAGFRRNQRMIDEGKPTLVAAFPGGNGTADMVKRARKSGLHVVSLESATK